MFTPQTIQDQMDFVSSISNLHFDKGPSHNTYQRNLCVCIEKRAPISVRNRLIYFSDTDKHDQFLDEVRKLVGENSQAETQEPKAKKFKTLAPQTRLYRNRVAQVTAQHILGSLPETPLPDTSSMSWPEDTSLFDLYTHQLLTNGTVVWRYHSPKTDVFVLNSYNIDSGVLIPISFEHVTISHQEFGPIIKCTCRAYKMLLACADKSDALTSDSQSVTCMHARLLKKYVINNFSTIVNVEPTEVHVEEISRRPSKKEGMQIYAFDFCTCTTNWMNIYFALKNIFWLNLAMQFYLKYFQNNAHLCTSSYIAKAFFPFII